MPIPVSTWQFLMHTNKWFPQLAAETWQVCSEPWPRHHPTHLQPGTNILQEALTKQFNAHGTCSAVSHVAGTIRCPHTFVNQLLPERARAQNKSEGDRCSFKESRERISFSEVLNYPSAYQGHCSHVGSVCCLLGSVSVKLPGAKTGCSSGLLTGADRGADNLQPGLLHQDKKQTTAGSPSNSTFKIKVQTLSFYYKM